MRSGKLEVSDTGGSFGARLLCFRATVDRMFMLVRRVVAALSMTGMVAALFRIRGTGGVPPQTEGWREVTGTDLR